MKGIDIAECGMEESGKKEYWLGIAVCALLLSGFAKLLLSGFPEIAPYWWAYGCGCVLFSVVLFWINRKQYREWVFIAGAGIAFLLFLLNAAEIRNGMCVLANEWLSFLTGKTGTIYLDFPVSGEGGAFFAIALLFILLTLLIVRSAQKKKILPAVLLSLAAMAGCACGFFETDYGLCLIVAGILCLLFYQKIKIASSKGFLAACFCFAAAVLISGAAAFFAGNAAKTELSSKQAVLRFETALHRLRYDSGVNAMPEGNLVNPGGFERSEETALVITADVPQKFYLRGMTGEVYTGSSWESLGEDARKEGEDLFYWLHESGFYGQTSIAQAAALRQEESVSLKIENVSACREYQFLPYALAENASLNAEAVGDDKNIASSGILETVYDPGSVPQWYELASWLSLHQEDAAVGDYLAAEQSYREFVYDYDLQLTNTAAGVFERLFGTEEEESRSLSEILELVSTTLEERLEYRENVSTYNGKNDFLKYTLEQSKCGYSIHYATAAVLMLRYFGVPARYVEGYFLSADEASGYEAGEEIELTESHAHAWAEYYMDGIGWIPFEVTPGYIDDEELETAMEMASEGLGDGTGKSFNQNPLVYTPPKLPEDNEDISDWNSAFRFEAKHVLFLLLVILFLLLLAGFLWIIRRRSRLLKFYRNMEEADNRSAVTGLYAYGMMLLGKCGLERPPGYEEIRQLNQEARFSSHKIQDSQKQQVKSFTEEITELCRTRCSFWKRFRYHYIFWLFR